MDAYELARSISEDQEFLYNITPQRSRDIELFLQKCREHLVRRREFPIVDLPEPDNDPYAVYFIGDTAGDVFSTIQLYKRFSYMKDRLTEEAIERGYGEIGVKLVFLGNYSGRPPVKLSKGGIQNLLFLLSQVF